MPHPRIISTALLLAFAATFCARAQLRSIQGMIGGEYERYGYFSSSGDNIRSRFRQLASAQVSGYLFHPDIAEVEVSSRFMNSNGSFLTAGTASTLRERNLGFYDCSVNLLRNNNLPTTLFARREVNTSEVANGYIPSTTTEILNTSAGFRFSPRLGRNGSKTPLFSFEYLDYASRSLTPIVPLDQKGKTYTLALEMSKIRNVNLFLDLIYRSQNDLVTGILLTTREGRFQGLATPGEKDQINLNGTWYNERQTDRLNGYALWNRQFGDASSNAVQVQTRWYQSPYFASADGELQEELNIAFSPQWRGHLLAGHSEGRTFTGDIAAPLRQSRGTAGIRHENAFGRFAGWINLQGSYQRVQSGILRTGVEGIAAGGVRTTGFSLGQISLSEQFQARRWSGAEGTTLFQNNINLTVESNAIPYLFLRNNSSYTVDWGLEEAAGIRDDNLFIVNDATYQWRWGMQVYLTAQHTYNSVRRGDLTNRVNRFSIALQIPDFLPSLALQGRILETFDNFRGVNEYNYDATLTWYWRSIAFDLRFIGYSFSSLKRHDMFVSIHRQFDFRFE